MTKRLERLAALLVATLLAFALGCAGGPQKESTGEYIDDAVITTKVKSAILNEPTLKVADIKVETFKGRVQLSGFVNSRADMSRAIELARNVGGVTSVANDMRIK